MTLNQLESLTEDELAFALHVVNFLFPLDCPKMQLEPRHLTWFKKGVLEQKIQASFPHVKREGHEVFSSLLNKLGVPHEIRYEKPPAPPQEPPQVQEPTGSNPVTSSV